MTDVAWPKQKPGLPKHTPSWRTADQLWTHSCFEAFVKCEGQEGYLELNFATSCMWAAYSFESYRAGMQRRDDLQLFKAIGKASAPWPQVVAAIQLPAAFNKPVWEVGLSAVIEQRGGTKSYWALAHPPGAPDFHHPTCFAATLPPPEQS